jgi:hypothetical protein
VTNAGKTMNSVQRGNGFVKRNAVKTTTRNSTTAPLTTPPANLGTMQSKNQTPPPPTDLYGTLVSIGIALILAALVFGGPKGVRGLQSVCTLFYVIAV